MNLKFDKEQLPYGATEIDQRSIEFSYAVGVFRTTDDEGGYALYPSWSSVIPVFAIKLSDVIKTSECEYLAKSYLFGRMTGYSLSFYGQSDKSTANYQSLPPFYIYPVTGPNDWEFIFVTEESSRMEVCPFTYDSKPYYKYFNLPEFAVTPYESTLFNSQYFLWGSKIWHSTTSMLSNDAWCGTFLAIHSKNNVFQSTTKTEYVGNIIIKCDMEFCVKKLDIDII